LTKHENVQAGGGARSRGGALTWALGAVHEARWPLKIALGLAASLSGVVLRLALDPRIFGHLPFQAYYPGVIAASILGGLVPGVAAAAASALWGALSMATTDPAPALRLALFLINSLSISGLAEVMHRALWRLGEAEGRRVEAERLRIASEGFRLTQASEAIAAFDLDVEKNKATDVDALRRMFGLAPETIINPDAIRSVALKDDIPKINAALGAAYDPAGDGAYVADYRIRRPSDGAMRWLAARGQVFFAGGRPVRMIGVCRDVTGERTADHALRISWAHIPLFVECAPISVAMFDRDMVYLAASRGWIEAYGRGRKSLTGLSHYALHPDIPDRWKAVHRGVLNGEFHTADDDRWVDSEGQERWVRWAAYPWTNEEGGIGGVILSAAEITAQRRAEAALRESEEKFRNAFAEAAVGFVMGDAEGAILEANGAFCRLTGYSEAELKSMRLTDLLHPDDRTETNALDETLRAGDGPGFVVETRYARKDGAIIWVRKSAALTRGAEAGGRWIVNLVEDVTERKQSEERAARTVAQLSAILDGAKDAVISIDVAGTIQSVNAACVKIFGYERGEMVGRNVSMLMPPGDARRHDGYLADYLRTGVAKIIGVGRETEGRRKDGKTFPIDLAIVEAVVDGDLIFVGFVRDLSERRSFEMRMDQLSAQRLTAIGGMAGALSHELNQPLAAVAVYVATAQRMLSRAPDDRLAPVEDALKRAGQQVDRMGDMIRRLRGFVAHGEADKRHHSLHELIREAVAAEFPDGRPRLPVVTLSLDAEDDEVLMDRIQIGQVLSNLLRNAREATVEAGGSHVMVSTERIGEGVIQCDVSDDGPGLADAVRENLFEPLASSKANGMGVGLSISKSIVEAHYGRIWGESGPGGGAAFSFTLPLAVAESEE
jgi:two-component system, LuxR family, sensor kinase FixL